MLALFPLDLIGSGGSGTESLVTSDARGPLGGVGSVWESEDHDCGRLSTNGKREALDLGIIARRFLLAMTSKLESGAQRLASEETKAGLGSV